MSAIVAPVTLTTACFSLQKYHRGCSPEKSLAQQMDPLLRAAVYLVVFTDKDSLPALRDARQRYGLDELAQYHVCDVQDLWAYGLAEQVRANREKYWPTRDDRTCVESHLVCLNKSDFVLQTIESNPFHTTKFGWIDALLDKEASGGRNLSICENYEPLLLQRALMATSDDKYHLQVLNVTDKAFKQTENKRTFYEQYRWIQCGGFHTFGADIGRRVHTRVKQLAVTTTELGYGHGEEMLFLEVLDEYYDRIRRSYGDYRQILHNFAHITKNVHYIYHLILKNYLRLGYLREAFDLCRELVFSAEHNLADFHPLIEASIYKIYENLLMGEMTSGDWHVRNGCKIGDEHARYGCRADPLVPLFETVRRLKVNPIMREAFKADIL